MQGAVTNHVLTADSITFLPSADSHAENLVSYLTDKDTSTWFESTNYYGEVSMEITWLQPVTVNTIIMVTKEWDFCEMTMCFNG